MDKVQEIFYKLSDGYSTQAETANRFWLVLLISSIITLVGNVENVLDPVLGTVRQTMELPLALGRVNPSDFYSIAVVLISVLIIAATSAMIQSIRNRRLIDKLLKSVQEKNQYLETIHLRDIFDTITTPTYIRVAPISQFLLGESQFLGDTKPKKWRKTMATALYLLLKVFSLALIYLLPFFALKASWSFLWNQPQTGNVQIPVWILYCSTFVAFLCILILLYADIKFVQGVLRRIFN